MITKAVVPIAGKGSRLAPMTSVVPKGLFPLVDSTGRCRPVIHWICAEAAAAGIEELAVVVSPDQQCLVERYFAAVREFQPALPGRIELLAQDRPLGFGDALLRAEKFVGGENFLLMLGDHVYRRDIGAAPCAAQVVAAFEKLSPAAMIGVQAVDEGELERVGVVRGRPLDANVYRCADFVEKPSRAVAQERLVTAGLETGQYLAHAGLYAFSPEIFACIAEIAGTGAKQGEEACPYGRDFQTEIALADAQSLLLARRPDDYCLCRIQGGAYDIGTPQGYAVTMAAFVRDP